MDYFVKKDYYNILQIKSDAKPEEIKAAYRVLAKEFHPDLHSNNPLAKLADEKFKEINEAYEVLSNESKRKEYDKVQLQNQNFNNFTKSTSKTEQTETKNNNYGENFDVKKENKNKSHQENQKRKVNRAEVCYRHSDRVGVAKCECCEVNLCEECSELFNDLWCFDCIQKNNKSYMNRMLMPLIVTIILLIVGFIIGIVVGIKYKLLSNNGIIEGLGLSLYLTSLWLYIWYIGNSVKKYIYYVVKAIDYIFNLSETFCLFILNLLTLLVGVIAGWVFGLLMGFTKLKKDYLSYSEFKTEHKRVKDFIKENY